MAQTQYQMRNSRLGPRKAPPVRRTASLHKAKKAKWRRVEDLIIDASYDSSEKDGLISGDIKMASTSMKRISSLPAEAYSRSIPGIGKVLPRSPLEPQGLNHFYSAKPDAKKLDQR
ncbi:hypothetical protein SARC_03884 [Sphaeroforma arctica JP610]|uniref:Uncharacterized protein n=1 Tax=Sphaeroforma arctica JP610 TaxID=667725 RepID=A0A0L0G4Z6_9EUKA|nr:hypothetical protein SARC_03884 [Sphaeroforma arctica JP610]KNC83896.1 hypothetical protein SARC_03884 [Sphaeroforma arctica JP610]|eukprot:XP_014157798.1 hypothetical protein SARC_03884 [Sphaeroforma arctica JP610]